MFSCLWDYSVELFKSKMGNFVVICHFVKPEILQELFIQLSRSSGGYVHCLYWILSQWFTKYVVHLRDLPYEMRITTSLVCLPDILQFTATRMAEQANPLLIAIFTIFTAISIPTKARFLLLSESFAREWAVEEQGNRQKSGWRLNRRISTLRTDLIGSHYGHTVDMLDICMG